MPCIYILPQVAYIGYLKASFYCLANTHTICYSLYRSLGETYLVSRLSQRSLTTKEWKMAAWQLRLWVLHQYWNLVPVIWVFLWWACTRMGTLLKMLGSYSTTWENLSQQGFLSHTWDDRSADTVTCGFGHYLQPLSVSTTQVLLLLHSYHFVQHNCYTPTVSHYNVLPGTTSCT